MLLLKQGTVGLKTNTKKVECGNNLFQQRNIESEGGKEEGRDK